MTKTAKTIKRQPAPGYKIKWVISGQVYRIYRLYPCSSRYGYGAEIYMARFGFDYDQAVDITFDLFAHDAALSKAWANCSK